MPKKLAQVIAPRGMTEVRLEHLLMTLGGSAGTLALRILRLFPAYLHSCGLNPEVEMSLNEELAIRREFICFLLSEDYLDEECPAARPQRGEGPGSLRARTTQLYLATMRRHGIRAGHLADAEARINDHVFQKGLAKLSARDAPIRPRAYPEFREMLRLCFGEVRERDDQMTRREIHLRCFWFLLIVTGARPANLLICPFRVTREGVWVGWRWRKGGRVQLRGETLYRFDWTTPPPRELHRTLLDISQGWRERPHQGPWYFQDCGSAATVVNNWLGRRRPNPTERWTSTTPRNKLSSTLLQRVHAGSLSELNFVWLMDHTVQTARGHYASSRDAAGLEKELEGVDSEEDEVFAYA